MTGEWVPADWPPPRQVRGLVTTRLGGASEGAFAGFNLAAHVGDAPDRVKANRRRLQEALEPGVGVQWIKQVHGTRVLNLSGEIQDPAPAADAIYTTRRGIACGVLTADCLPVCLCEAQGTEIAVAHAGWRGLAAGVLESALACFSAPPDRLLAWLGPAIGPCHFEVGEDVREAFLRAANTGAWDPAPAFRAGKKPGKWMADLYELARIRLRSAGVSRIYGGGRCTYCEREDFYSYRRDGVTGRFATLIYRI